MVDIIQLSHIQRDFEVGDQTVHALNDVCLGISSGEYISVMGPSGSGKSTLLNLIGLLDRPTSGDYFLNGKRVSTLSEREQARVRNRSIGFVFQTFHLLARLTAFDNIELPLVLAGVRPVERKSRVREVLQATNMSERACHKPQQLSGGERQRVAIARATIMQPSVILADEPTGNLDRRSGLDIVTLLESLNTKGITLILVTHDTELGKRARRHIVMVDGGIKLDTRK